MSLWPGFGFAAVRLRLRVQARSTGAADRCDPAARCDRTGGDAVGRRSMAARAKAKPSGAG